MPIIIQLRRAAFYTVCAVLLWSTPPPASAAVNEQARAGYFQRALEFIDKKDYPGAVILLKNALQADPRDLSARVELANTYLKMEDGASAEKELLRARRDGAQENFIIAPLGHAYLLQGKYDLLLKNITVTGTSPEVQAQVLLVRGLTYLAQRRYAEAETAFTESLQAVSVNGAPYRGLARIAIARNLLDDAQKHIRDAVKYSPDDAETWFIQGELSRLRNQRSSALEQYSRSITVAPNFHLALLARARILVDQGKHAEAEPDVLHVLRQQKRDPHAAYLHALILTAKGDVNGARSALNDADQILKAIGPEFIRFDPPLLLLAGVVSYFRRDFERSYQQLSQYHREVPHHLGARKLLAALEIGRNRPLQAVSLLGPVAKASPGDFEVQIMYGDALRRAGRPEESRKVLADAARIAPDSAGAMTQLAMLRLVSGQEDAAIENLKAALERDRDATHLAVMLSLAQLRRNQNEDAIATARIVTERDPKNPVPYNLIAGAFLKLKNVTEARRNFEAAIAANPNYRPAIANLAKLELSQGAFEKAYDLYSGILETNPLNGKIMMALADIDRRRDRPEDAIRWLLKARAISRDRKVASLRLVEAYIAARKYEMAIRTAEALRAQDPGNIIYLAALGRAYLDGKKLADAAKLFTELSTRSAEAKSALWVFRAGEWQEKARDADGARRSYEQAVELNPKFLPPRLALFRHDMIARDYDGALARADDIAVVAPNTSIADTMKGDVYMARREFAAAAAAYARVIGAQPDVAPSVALRAYRAKRATNADDALGFVEKWAAGRTDTPARKLLANAYSDFGKQKQAIDIYEKLLADAPKDAALLNNLAVLYNGRDDARALSLAKRAVDAAPQSAAVLDTYGWLLVKQGKASEAFGMLRNAQLRAPNVPEIRYHMAVALDALGRKSDALREVSAALRMSRKFDGAADARKLMARLSAQ